MTVAKHLLRAIIGVALAGFCPSLAQEDTPPDAQALGSAELKTLGREDVEKIIAEAVSDGILPEPLRLYGANDKPVASPLPSKLRIRENELEFEENVVMRQKVS